MVVTDLGTPITHIEPTEPEPRKAAQTPRQIEPIPDPNELPDLPKYYIPADVPPSVEEPEPGVYLDPDDFPEAPAELRQALSSLGCRIPQVPFWSLPDEFRPQPPHNLVSGYFKSLESLHWAVLCSRSGESALLLVLDGIESGIATEPTSG